MQDKINKRSALLVATLVSFIAPFMGSAINVALPALGREFALDAIALNWVATSYLLASAIFLVPFGRLADIYGRKRIFACGILVYTTGSLLCALARSGPALLCFRVVQGVGSAMVVGTSVAILSSVFPPGERGKVLGINVAAVYLGLSCGPFFGGFLTYYLGWRSIFSVNVLLGLLIIAVTSWKLKGEWAGARGQKFDILGAAIYSFSLLSMMYGLSRLPTTAGVVFLASGGLGWCAFAWWSSRTPQPLLDIRQFSNNRTFAMSNLTAFINYSSTFAVAFLLSLYLQYVKGLLPQQAGMVLVCQPIIQALFSPFAGRLSDRIEPRVIASAGMGFTALGLLVLSFLGTNTSLAYIIFALVLLGTGFGLFSSPNTNAIMGSVSPSSYGFASAMVGTMRLIGMMFSMGLVMSLFALYIGRNELTADHYPALIKSSKLAFALFCVFCGIGVFVSLARGQVRAKPQV